MDRSQRSKFVIGKTREFENHVFGVPKPHRSWRGLLLTAMGLGAVLFIMMKLGRKYVLHNKSMDSSSRLSAISEQVVSRKENNNKREWINV
jgi:hypothetical protein